MSRKLIRQEELEFKAKCNYVKTFALEKQGCKYKEIPKEKIENLEKEK